MRFSTDVEGISAAYDVPAVLKENEKTDGEPTKNIESGYDVNDSTKSERSSKQQITTLVISDISSANDRTIDLETDDNASKISESDIIPKITNDQAASVEEQVIKLNGAEADAVKKENENGHGIRSNPQKKKAVEELSEKVNGIDADAGVINADREIRSSTESRAESENGAVETDELGSSESTGAKPKSSKRKISLSSEDDQPPPAKSARTNLEANLEAYGKLLDGMLEKTTSSNDPDNMQLEIEQLSSEIESLNEAARAKEREWNNILYLKKMKEDMLVRLNRKKSVMEIMNTKILDDPENLVFTMNNHSGSGHININNNINDNSNSNDVNLAESNDSLIDIRKQLVNTFGPSASFLMPKGSSKSLDITKERSNMNSSDLAKEKSNISKLHRNIQSKSEQIHCSDNAIAATLSSLASLPRSSPAIQLQHEYLQQRLREDVQNAVNNQDNGANKMQIGRQGPIKDVKSLIDDFRQRHPEQVPRRGRRMKNNSSNAYLSDHGVNSGRLGDNDLCSPPSSNDSTYNSSQLLTGTSKIQSAAFGAAGNSKQSYELNTKIAPNPLTSTPLFKNQQHTPLGYPEVTLHPIQSSNLHVQNQKHGKDNHQPEAAHTNSLLHGILTKSSRQRGSATVTSGMTAGLSNSFSPTLARLLTAPERNLAMGAVQPSNACGNGNNSFFGAAQAAAATGNNLTKNGATRMQQQLQQSQPEISCLPVSQMFAFHQQNQNNSLLHQQLQRHQRDINKYKSKSNAFMCGTDDDEAEDSVDRLVIDEGDQYSNSDIAGPSGLGRNNDNELPECQGCKKREAQFVCADCQRQWYCSRECQVMAWDEHSEVCAR